MKIQNCVDYRDYLKFQVAKKKSSPTKSFSYQGFATKVGVSKTYLKLVVEKKNHASLDRLFDICTYFDLTDFEMQFIVFLFLKNTSETKKSIHFFNSILKSYVTTRPEVLNEGVQNYYKNFDDWVSTALRELTSLHGYQHDSAWIQNKLGGTELVSKAAVVRAMKILESENFVSKSAEGWNVQKHSNNFSDVPPWDDDLVKGFKSGLGRAGLAIDHYNKSDFHNPCRYHMYSFSLSEEALSELMTAYDEFKLKIEQIVSDDSSPQSRAVFISNNAFCVSTPTSRRVP